jgi:hypothetical protein
MFTYLQHAQEVDIKAVLLGQYTEMFREHNVLCTRLNMVMDESLGDWASPLTFKQAKTDSKNLL